MAPSSCYGPRASLAARRRGLHGEAGGHARRWTSGREQAPASIGVEGIEVGCGRRLRGEDARGRASQVINIAFCWSCLLMPAGMGLVRDDSWGGSQAWRLSGPESSRPGSPFPVPAPAPGGGMATVALPACWRPPPTPPAQCSQPLRFCVDAGPPRTTSSDPARRKSLRLGGARYNAIKKLELPNSKPTFQSSSPQFNHPAPFSPPGYRLLPRAPAGAPGGRGRPNGRRGGPRPPDPGAGGQRVRGLPAPCLEERVGFGRSCVTPAPCPARARRPLYQSGKLFVGGLSWDTTSGAASRRAGGGRGRLAHERQKT